VTGNADEHQLLVRERVASRHRRHTPVYRVEAVGPIQEIGRRLGRAADTGKLAYIFRLHPHLIHSVDDALGDGVMAAARAQSGLAAAIVEHGQPDVVGFGSWSGRGRHYRASWATIASVTERASMGRPL